MLYSMRKQQATPLAVSTSMMCVRFDFLQILNVVMISCFRLSFVCQRALETRRINSFQKTPVGQIVLQIIPPDRQARINVKTVSETHSVLQ